MARRSLLLLLTLAACTGGERESPPAKNEAAVAVPAPAGAPAPAAAPAQPSAPAPSSSPDDEAQAALAVVRSYFAHIEKGEHAAAWALRWHGEGDDAASRQAFIENYARYAEHRATIGPPGPVEGAAGSLYVEVPVQLYGRLKSGAPFSSAGTVTLRRVNDVPGSSAEQRRWHIYSRD